VLRTRRTHEQRANATGIATAIAAAVEPLHGHEGDYDSLLELIGDARFVLIGEASHGTHEFYDQRAAITRRLITEKHFGAVCIEGDWPDAHRVDRYLQGVGNDRSAEEALEGFKRFPTWMWRNEVVRDFVAWLRNHNLGKRPEDRVGFYGLDLYSMFASIRRVLEYLERVDPEAADRARFRYSCFENFEEDSQAYGYATAANIAEPCEDEAVRQLVELRARSLEYASADGRRALDDFFSAEQNATLVRNAEHYYRSMFRGRVSSWNLRDRHMADTLDAIEGHLQATGRATKLVVWAHNSHIGDARFTDMGRRGELNLGQLVRERHGDSVRLIGFSTNTGTVTAAHDWDEPGQQMRVRPALQGSYERAFADVAARWRVPRFLLRLRQQNDATDVLSEPRLQRAIGVIYRPETERQSHYYDVELPHQLDAVIHLDVTRAIRGLEPGEAWEKDVQEPPETYPTGI
jgi:erythromycin esterase-like protein